MENPFRIARLTAGHSYYISVDNYGQASYQGTFSLAVNNQPSYDFREGAIVISNTSNWTSANAASTTVNATADRSKGSCWSTGPNYNRWFMFRSTSTGVTIDVMTGRSYGTMQYPYLALWDSTGNQVACQIYSSATGTMELSYQGLTSGNWYYISVDNYGQANYRGTFTLAVNATSYDYLEGAVALSNASSWSSGNAAYSTLYATPDRSKGSTWTNGPNNNRWFKFTAPFSSMTISLSTGGAVGTLQYPFIALWDSTVTQVASASYTSATATVTLNPTTLVAGRLYYISVDNSSGYAGSFSLNVSSNGTLPIELANFDVKMEDGKAIADWQTFSEINNDYFTIERSADDELYEAIGTVRGAGTSNVLHDYSFTDDNPLTHTFYYRLKQTDYNGNFKYFGPLALNDDGKKDFKVNAVSPNPFLNNINIEYISPNEGRVNVIIISMDGTTVFSDNVNVAEGAGTYTVNQLGELKAGIYILKLLQDNTILATRKLVKS